MGEGELYPPVFENVFIESIRAEKAVDYGIYINESEQQPIGKVHLKDIHIEKARVPVFIQNADNLHLDNVQIKSQVDN